MIEEVRRKYNSEFNEETYHAFLKYIGEAYHNVPKFRVAETPVFIPRQLKEHLFKACDDVLNTICRPDFKAITDAAMHPKYAVPNENK